MEEHIWGGKDYFSHASKRHPSLDGVRLPLPFFGRGSIRGGAGGRAKETWGQNNGGVGRDYNLSNICYDDFYRITICSTPAP